MAIEKIFWRTGDFLNGYDLHILRNNTVSERLDTHVKISSDLNNEYTVQQLNAAKANSTLANDFLDCHSVSFSPRVVNANNITVHATTGEITATALLLGAANIRSFIIDVVLKKTSGAGSDLVPAPDGITTLRVHVPNSVSSSWLSPSTLTIRPHITQMSILIMGVTTSTL